VTIARHATQCAAAVIEMGPKTEIKSNSH